MEDKHNNGMLQSLLLGGGSGGGGGSGLPPVTPADNGKLLGVDGGEWKAVDAPAGMEEITYSALKALRDGGNLVPGRAYRITDYVTVVNGSYDLGMLGASGYIHYARSAGHPFDLVVTATGTDSLSEDAMAVQHDGDTYFANSNLGGWSIKYALDNDPTRFSWADAANGKGVIWWMRDEYGNEAGCDFKNLQFLCYALKMADDGADPDGLCYSEDSPYRYGSTYGLFKALMTYMQSGTYETPFRKHDFAVGANILGATTFAAADETYLQSFGGGWYYTFDRDGADASLNAGGNVRCYENKIALCSDPLYSFLNLASVPAMLGLNCSVWQNTGSENYCYGNTLAENAYFNIFGPNCYANHIGATSYSNIFGGYCDSNTFSDNCYSNTFGVYCNSNTFGVYCNSNTFGVYCNSNTFGDSCYSNTFGGYCDSNTFGGYCHSNTFGGYCNSNTFGDNCESNTFGDNCNYNRLLANVRAVSITTGSITVRYLTIKSAFEGAAVELYDAALAGKSYPITIEKDSQGRLIMSWANGLMREGMVKADASDSWHTL